MIRAQTILEKQGRRFAHIARYDLEEIDNEDLYALPRLRYLDRLQTVLDLVTSCLPPSLAVRIGDFACGQGNISLSLAEMGYDVTGIDINETFLDYARAKHERGHVRWRAASFEAIAGSEEVFHVCIGGEIIEHCAHPENLVQTMMRCLRPGGYLLLTTPNADMIRHDLPTFSRFADPGSRAGLEARQFRPDGTDHLFLFTLEELGLLVPEGMRLVQRGFLGGNLLLHRRLSLFYRCLPLPCLMRLQRALSRTPLLNRRFSLNIYILMQKV